MLAYSSRPPMPIQPLEHRQKPEVMIINNFTSPYKAEGTYHAEDSHLTHYTPWLISSEVLDVVG